MDIRSEIRLDEIMRDVKSAAITGHVRPDGDCVGSCLGLWNYLTEAFPQVETAVYLEPFPEMFLFLNGADRIICEKPDRAYDVVFCLDCSQIERLGQNAVLWETASRRVCIDHHIFQGKFGDYCWVEPTASSASELTALLIGSERISKAGAEALYLGIVHDTGVFQYRCTSGRTMRVAADLMEKGIDYPMIVSSTFFERTYYQKQILGRALLESVRLLDGKVIFSAIRLKDMDFFRVTAKDLDGIVSELRSIKGVEAAIFLYESSPSIFKVSLRSSERVNVNSVAVCFGGGGHRQASGCEMQGSVHDVVNNLMEKIAPQLEEN